MTQINAFKGNHQVGSLGFKEGLVVFRNNELANDVIGVSTEDEQKVFQFFLSDFGGSFYHLELQPDQVLAVLFDIQSAKASEVKEVLPLKNPIIAHKLKMPAEQILLNLGEKH